MLHIHHLPRLLDIIMFSSLGLFKQVECPEQHDCYFPTCIFAHQTFPANEAVTSPQAESTASRKIHEGPFDAEGPRKKQRLCNGDVENTGLPYSNDGVTAQYLPGLPPNKDKAPSPGTPNAACREMCSPPLGISKFKEASVGGVVIKCNSTSSKPGVKSAPARKPAQETFLNPRMIQNPPASHAVRMQLITLLHEQMVRLNEEVKRSQDSVKSGVALSSPELILEALEEEENVAKQNPAVYMNVIKLQITKLRKMRLAEWKGERLKQIARNYPPEVSAKSTSELKRIETGLSQSQEIAFLAKLLAQQGDLAKHGYVPHPPNDEEVAQARAGSDAAQGWELCDRCKSRFQVFPGRRAEDGALTSGGTCLYHTAKPRKLAAKTNGDKAHREQMYECCNQSIGTSAGCTTAATHVFKVSDAKRLAMIMPFEKTPPKTRKTNPPTAVCFDCEMGYTTMGMELIRLTATAWPNGEELIDVLVRPLGEILDLNSRYSGVWPQDYADALPYVGEPSSKTNTTLESDKGSSKLCIVDTPATVRNLLFGHLTPETPLIGHAIDNDLNATRIIHPSIVDTVLLYPHPRGLPVRYGLKTLMKMHLNQDIQKGGAQGHDSKEDARAAGELVRLKTRELWKSMKRDGWTVRKTDFSPPLVQASKTALHFSRGQT